MTDFVEIKLSGLVGPSLSLVFTVVILTVSCSGVHESAKAFVSGLR